MCALRNVCPRFCLRAFLTISTRPERAEIYFSDSPVTPLLESILFETISLPDSSFTLSLSLSLSLTRCARSSCALKFAGAFESSAWRRKRYNGIPTFHRKAKTLERGQIASSRCKPFTPLSHGVALKSARHRQKGQSVPRYQSPDNSRVIFAYV